MTQFPNENPSGREKNPHSKAHSMYYSTTKWLQYTLYALNKSVQQKHKNYGEILVA
jgi:hypothetical protein